VRRRACMPNAEYPPEAPPRSRSSLSTGMMVRSSIARIPHRHERVQGCSESQAALVRGQGCRGNRSFLGSVSIPGCNSGMRAGSKPDSFKTFIRGTLWSNGPQQVGRALIDRRLDHNALGHITDGTGAAITAGHCVQGRTMPTVNGITILGSPLPAVMLESNRYRRLLRLARTGAFETADWIRRGSISVMPNAKHTAGWPRTAGPDREYAAHGGQRRTKCHAG